MHYSCCTWKCSAEESQLSSCSDRINDVQKSPTDSLCWTLQGDGHSNASLHLSLFSNVFFFFFNNTTHTSYSLFTHSIWHLFSERKSMRKLCKYVRYFWHASSLLTLISSQRWAFQRGFYLIFLNVSTLYLNIIIRSDASQEPT